MRTPALAVLFSCLVMLLPCRLWASGPRRIALVVGNASYQAAPLKNPLNDARDMAALLQGLGFTVDLRTDADRKAMKAAVRRFARDLDRAEVGLFYYAGHGVQIEGENYLIPVDARVESEADVEDQGVRAAWVLDKMREGRCRLALMLLDACRDNPFKGRYRSAGRGLAAMDAPQGAIVAYATSPGKVAVDGKGRNGLFTSALLRHLGRPGLPVRLLLNDAGRDVLRESSGLQVPWVSSTPGPMVYLAGMGSLDTARPAARTGTAEQAAPAKRTGPPPALSHDRKMAHRAGSGLDDLNPAEAGRQALAQATPAVPGSMAPLEEGAQEWRPAFGVQAPDPLSGERAAYADSTADQPLPLTRRIATATTAPSPRDQGPWSAWMEEFLRAALPGTGIVSLPRGPLPSVQGASRNCMVPPLSAGQAGAAPETRQSLLVDDLGGLR